MCACADMAASKIVYTKIELLIIRTQVELNKKPTFLSEFCASVLKRKQRKSHRGCRSGKNIKQRKTSKKWQLLLWNIEGYKNAVRESPIKDLFINYDIIFLNETFLCEPIKIPGYKPVQLKLSKY